jgi:hypothetical protein
MWRSICLLDRHHCVCTYVCVQSTEKTEGAAADGVVSKATAGDTAAIKLCTQPQASSSSSPDMTLCAHGCPQPTRTTTLQSAASVCGPCGCVDHDAATARPLKALERAWDLHKVESFQTDIARSVLALGQPSTKLRTSRSTCIAAKTHDAEDLCYIMRFDNVWWRVKLYSAYCIRTKQAWWWLGDGKE